jgi:signal transduction histidine kinase/uncharacterized protein (DUF952 family)
MMGEGDRAEGPLRPLWAVNRLAQEITRRLSSGAREKRRAALLFDAGAALATSIEYQTTIDIAVRLALPELADECRLHLVVDGERELAAVAHAEPADLPPIDDEDGEDDDEDEDEIARRLARAIAEQRPDLHHGPRSFVIAPFATDAGVHGALTCIFSTSGRQHNEDDLMLAAELAQRCGWAIEHAVRYRDALAATSARDELLAVVSHDLGNMLAPIRMTASQLTRSANGSGTMSRQIALIARASEQMTVLLDDLLDAATIEAGSFTVETRAYAAAALLADAHETLQAIGAARGVRVEAQAAPDLPPVSGDRRRLLQVLSNLGTNAIRFSPEGGEVRLVAELRGDEMRFAVSDGGPGVAEADRPYLFQRYWRGSDGRAGLGLYIAHGIIRAHGGRIWLSPSGAPGATFQFTLPIASGARTIDTARVRWLYHILPVSEDVGDPYRPSSLAREGFIHCSFREAVAESARLHFPPHAELVVLQIDPRRLTAHVEVADTPRGPMPHLHGPLPRSAVAATLPLSAVADAPDLLPR